MLRVEVTVKINIEESADSILTGYKLYKKPDGYTIFSTYTGFDYDLLEGTSIGTDTRYTSDIIFVMASGPDGGYTEPVGWFYGAGLLPEDIDLLYDIMHLVYDYERKKYDIR